MEIWIVRHGESIAELNKVMQGHADGELSERGLVQSQLLGFRLSYGSFNEIISSDSARAQQTTQEIVAYHKDTVVNFDSRLRERSLGVFEGKLLMGMKSEATKSGVSLRDYQPNGGETWNEVLNRSRLVLAEIIMKYVKKDFKEDKFELTSHPINIQISRKQTFSQSSYNNYSNNPSNYKKSNTIQVNETISKDKGKMIELKSEITDQKDYINKDFNQLFSDETFIKKMSRIYKGFQRDLSFPRVLIVSHSGWIMEFLNCIRIIKNIRTKFINDSNQTSLYVLKVYCVNCGSICYSKDMSCRLDIDMILYNNVDHLKI